MVVKEQQCLVEYHVEQVDHLMVRLHKLARRIVCAAHPAVRLHKFQEVKKQSFQGDGPTVKDLTKSQLFVSPSPCHGGYKVALN